MIEWVKIKEYIIKCAEKIMIKLQMMIVERVQLKKILTVKKTKSSFLPYHAKI